MIKIQKTEVLGWEHAIRGMRNPMNSWDKSDSCMRDESGDYYNLIGDTWPDSYSEMDICIGQNDHDLMLRLAKAGSVHAKFRRMIVVYADIIAPLYWWKEFDTYKVGTVVNSCSTMHKIHEKEFTLEDFSHEHLEGMLCYEDEPEKVYANYGTPFWHLQATIAILNEWRELFNNGGNRLWGGKERDFNPKDKDVWWQLIQLLPSSYNQKRTVKLNYEVLANVYQYRQEHKLDEWREFCQWIEKLPCAEIITCNATKGILLDQLEIWEQILSMAKTAGNTEIQVEVEKQIAKINEKLKF